MKECRQLKLDERIKIAQYHKNGHSMGEIARFSDLRKYIIYKIKHEGWSPEQISGSLRYRQKTLPYISHESIYKWIYDKT